MQNKGGWIRGISNVGERRVKKEVNRKEGRKVQSKIVRNKERREEKGGEKQAVEVVDYKEGEEDEEDRFEQQIWI